MKPDYTAITDSQCEFLIKIVKLKQLLLQLRSELTTSIKTKPMEIVKETKNEIQTHIPLSLTAQPTR